MATNGTVETPFVTQTILESLVDDKDSSKFELISRIWPNSNLSAEFFHDGFYTSFIHYVREELLLLREYRSQFAAQSLDGTIDLIDILRSNFDRPQAAIIQLLRDQFRDASDADILRSLDLAARLLLTIHVQSEGVAIGPANYGAVDWPSNISLKELVTSQLRPIPEDERSTKKLSQAQLDPSFTAASLIDVCGIEIAWTHNLADHLTLDKRRRVLTVYEHKICLVNHSKDSESLIPRSTVLEAIDTLNLLFPFGNGPTRLLLQKKLKRPLYTLGYCERPLLVRLTDYNVWRTKIADLVELYDEPPKDLKQLLGDRRNLTNWWTTWLGIWVLILTLVSIAFGTVSTLYAIKQYELALAQACSAEGAAQLLPKYCG